MKIRKGWWTAALLCCLLALLLAVSAGAEEPEWHLIDASNSEGGLLQEGCYDIFQRPPGMATFSNHRPVDPPGYQEILEGLRNMDETIDLRGVGVRIAEVGDLLYLVTNENAELFYIRGGLWYNTDDGEYVTQIKPKYNVLKDRTLVGNFNAAADEALLSALGSTDGAGMSDLQKALALHDWIVLNCTYNFEVANDLTNDNEKERKVHSAYGTLVDKDAVCEGIALAYTYLLRRVGVNSGYVLSTPMNHAWNWVQIGDKFYHVDATHDDPVFSANGKKSDLPGYCSHKHFLRADGTDHLLNHHGYIRISDQIGETDSTYETGWLFNDAETGFFWYKPENQFYYVAQDEIKTASDDSALHQPYPAPARGYYNRVTLRAGNYICYFYDTSYYSNRAPLPPKLKKYNLKDKTGTDLNVLATILYDPWLHGLKVSGSTLNIVQVNGTASPGVLQTFDLDIATEDTVKVTFNTQDGSDVSPVSLLKGGRVAKPVDPTKDGYIFDGWYKDSACTNSWNFQSDTVTENITLYAKWIEDVILLSGNNCGASGTNLSWVLRESGLLTISGSGAMKDYAVGEAPWFASRAANDVKTVVIKDGVTSIGANAFNGCSTMTSASIPNSVSSIGENAFGGCSGLTALKLPGAMTAIGAGAFNGCTGLTELTIPSSVTTIGEGAFSGCSSNLTLKVTPGSAAETYAKNHGIKYNNGSSSSSSSGRGLPRTDAEDGTAVHGVVFVLLAAMSLCAWTIGRKRNNR